VPDVSADADPNTGYQIFAHGKSWVFGGTSAGAPLWAALIAIMNQRAGKRFGFLNPQLYALGGGSISFRDITIGTNDNSGNAPPLPFNAGVGWDACTGLGSPNGAALLFNLLNFLVKIVSERDECGIGGSVPDGIARFHAEVTGVPIGAAVTYAWSVSGAGAIAVPPTNSWALQVKLGKTAAPVSIGVQVVVEGVQRSAQISYVPDTEQIVRIRELFCEIRRVVQVSWWIDPLWDPLRDLVLQPYSPIELQRMVALGGRLSTLANEALLLERSAPPVTALGPAARRGRQGIA
jgi:hypothetical protein